MNSGGQAWCLPPEFSFTREQKMQSSKPSSQVTDKSKQPAKSASPQAGQEGKGKVQGEGDYESNRRYTESAKEFVASGKVDAAARNAKPQSKQESAEMRKAEQEGASHAKGGPSPSDRKTSPKG